MPGKVLSVGDALRNPVRRRIIRYLLEKPGASIRQLSRDLGISLGSISGHIVILERVGLVREERTGNRLRLYVDEKYLLRGGFGMHASLEEWGKGNNIYTA